MKQLDLAVVDEIEDVNAELGGLDDLWVATRDAERETPIPDSIGERIAVILTEIEETEALLPPLLEQVLALQDQVGERSQAVRDLMERIEAEQAESLFALLRLDYPPLWEAAASDSRAAVASQASALRDEI